MTARRTIRNVAGASALAVVVITSLAPRAGAARADTYYEIWCETPDGLEQAETVNAHAIQLDKTPGGKDDAIELFNRNYPFPGYECFLRGPFSSS
jgi:hypothetical protein